MSSNLHLFFHFNNSTSLSPITLANGLEMVARAIGSAKPLPNVSLNFLYVPHYPFNSVYE